MKINIFKNNKQDKKINFNLNLFDNWQQKLKHILYYIAVFLYLELTLHIAVYHSISPRIIYPILFAFVSGSILYIVCSLLPEKVNRIIGILAVFGFVIYYEVQLVYHCIFGSFLPISQMTMGADAVTNFFAQVIYAILKNIISVILLFLPTIVTPILFFKKVIPTKRTTLLQIPAFCIISLALSGVVMLTLHTFNTSDSSAYAVLVNANSSTEASVKNVGLAVTTIQETRGLINAQNNTISFVSSTLNDLKNDTKQRNESEIDFYTIGEGSDDQKVKSISNFLSTMSPTAKNDYTGIAKGYNLITICAESFSPVAISEELTPTLYKLSNSGFIFKNYYNCFPNTTTNGEYSFIMGLMPNMSRTKVASSFDDSIGNYLPYALGNIYSEMGMPANAYHNYYATFYDRNITHQNLGYDFKAIDAGLNIEVNWPSSDLDMIKASMPEYINSDTPFHTYYMTFSGHYQYDWDNAMSAKNKDKVDHLPYSEAAKAYIACNLELEYALQALMEGLEEAGKADNTVIVLTGDHYPYGLSEEEFNELAGYEVDTDFEKYRNSFICYIPGMEKVVVEDYCSTPDILPTVLNIMGLEYDSRLLAGKDVLSDAPAIAVLADQSYITNGFRYNATTGEIISDDGSEIDPFIVQDYCNYVANMFTLSNGILETDYYSIVFDRKSDYSAENYINYSDITSPFTEAAATFMVKNGYMAADDPVKNKFGVNRKVAMSDFVSVVYKMAGSPIMTNTDGKDSALVWATTYGILEDEALWDQNVTYGQAALITYKYIDMVLGIPMDTDYETINMLCEQFPDIPREHIIAAKWNKDKKIAEGKGEDGILSSYGKTINRGQMATYLQRMYFYSINKE